MVLRRVGSQSTLPVLLGLAALVSGCVGADGRTRPLGEDAARLAVSARFALASAAQADEPAPIHRIRLTGRASDTGDILGESVQDVDPDGAPWRVSLGVELPGRTAAEVVVFMELIHVGDGSESVEWSGRSEPIRVEAGSAEEVSEVTLYRGPLSNLTVTGIEITGRGEGSLLEGGSLRLGATVEAEQGTPVVFWSSTDPGVLEVGEDGVVLGVAPGTAGVVAEAGPVDDEVELEVLPRAAELLVVAGDGQTADPGTAVDVAPVFRVVNPGGTPVAGVSVGFAVDGTGDVLAFRTLAVTQANDIRAMETCGIATDDTAYCWGTNQHGQLGATGGESCMSQDTPVDCRSTPAPVSGGHRFADLAVGLDHVCGVSSDGVAYCWGNNATGQLGDGSTTASQSPVRVAAPSEAVVAARAPALRLRPVRR